MTASQNRSIYSDAFEGGRPNLSFAATSARLSLSRAFTTDLASYYHERAALETAYVNSLEKLRTRLHGTSSSTVFTAVEALGLDSKDADRQLGAWKGVQDRLETEVVETARVHEQWRKKVVEEVEGPLRSSLGKQEWIRWGQNDRDLASTVHEYESTLEKVQKAQSKGGSKASKSATSKLLSTQSHLSTLGSALTSALPPFLNASQALDASHAAFLKEALIRYGTISSDLGRERMEAGERVLVAVFSIDEESEMQGWALRESMRAGAGVVDRARPVNGAEFGAPSSNEGVREQTIQEEPNSLRAPVQERERVPSISRTAPPPVASLALPTPAPVRPAHPPSSGSHNGSTIGNGGGGGSKFSSLFKRDRSSSVAGSSKYGNLDVPSSSQQQAHDRQSIDSRQSDDVDDGMAGREGSTKSKKRESLMPFSSGGLFRRGTKMGPSGGGPSPSLERRESEVVQPAPARQEQPKPQEPTANVDEEGYSVPPAGYDKQPWESKGGGANLMDDDDEGAEEASALPVARVPNVAIAPSTITETDSDRQAALERVKSTLLSSKPLGGPTSSPLLGSPNVGGVTRRGTARGRRDVRTTTYNPVIPDDVPLGRLLEQQRAQEASALSTPSRMPSIPFTSSPTGAMFGERANSMLSVASTVGGRVGVVDPFEGATTPGLRASIVETVNVLSKGGVVSRVMITGEISLSHRLAAGASTDGVRIRIAHFEQFEKAAPNSAYLSPVPDSPGEYLVSPSLSTTPSSAVVLKYQLHVPAGSEDAFVPLHVRANWRCEPTQTRVMVVYAPNPSAKLASSGEESPFGEEEEARLGDVSFQVPMSVNAVTFQAKPAAVWSPEHAKLTFAVQGVGLGGGEEGKLLASIATESQAVAQPVAVRWKCAGRCVSGVGVEVVGGEQVEEVLRTTVSGKYLVAP